MTQTTTEAFSSQRKQDSLRQDKRRINFSNGDHEQHLQMLKAWLHPDLRDLPGVDWTNLPSKIIGYLIDTVGDSPYAPHLALAALAASGPITTHSLRSMLSTLYGLMNDWRRLGLVCDGEKLTKDVWNEYVTKTEKNVRRRKQLLNYSSFSDRHIPDYLEQLDAGVRRRLAHYIHPRLTTRFVEQHSGAEAVYADQRRRRKQKSDVLTPLHSILVALIQLRKQAAQRLFSAFQQACERAESGEAFPLSFSYEETVADINRDARTVADVRLEKKTVQLTFKRWNRRTWVMNHPGDFSKKTRQRARFGLDTYHPQIDRYFVEFLGNSADLLWFGDLVANKVFMRLRGLRQLKDPSDLDEKNRARLEYASSIGFSRGVTVDRPGLLTPAGSLAHWLLRAVQQRNEALVFDPESLYRGCLFGAALATIALTNGSRVSELLQVSADRFKGHAYEEKINGQLTGKERVIWLQYLIPKGKRSEAERQLFPISPQSYELLREIASLLKQTHGYIPSFILIQRTRSLKI
jgi:hypothetical protein